MLIVPIVCFYFLLGASYSCVLPYEVYQKGTAYTFFYGMCSILFWPIFFIFDMIWYIKHKRKK
jgi:hypothetical protein